MRDFSREIVEVKREIERHMNRAKALYKAWCNIKFNKTKNGEWFKTKSKNIDGAKFEHETTTDKGNRDKLTVYTYASGYGYIHDTLYCYFGMDYPLDKYKHLAKEKPQNIVSIGGYYSDWYDFDMNDIQMLIANRIEELAKSYDAYQRDLEIIDKVINEFGNALYDCVTKMDSATESCKYLIRNAFKIDTLIYERGAR